MISMIDRRKPKIRRTGERRWHVIFSRLLLLLVLLAAGWCGFEYGRWSMQSAIAALKSDVMVFQGITAAGHTKGRK
jgi:hypothetical protein